jgi:hypothetical protein
MDAAGTYSWPGVLRSDVAVVSMCGARGLCGARRGRGVGSGACEVAVVGHRGVARPGDVAAESTATRVGGARRSGHVCVAPRGDVVATTGPRP